MRRGKMRGRNQLCRFRVGDLELVEEYEVTSTNPLVVRISSALLATAALLASGTASAVGPASPPSVVTGAASNIGPTSATVAGTVNPHGLATTYLFEYGQTT